MSDAPLAIPLQRNKSIAICAIGVASIMLIAALIELKMGRLLISKSGHIQFWVGKGNLAENSQQIADWYSLSHIIHGFLFYGFFHLLSRLIGRRSWPVEFRLVLATLVEACWEIVENTPYVIGYYRSETISWGYTGDTVLNSMSDICFAIIGFILARYLPVWLTIVLMIAMEILAALVIRDGLLLNILMFIHPFGAIKHWQAGA